MTPKQAEEASMLERELRDIANVERAAYKRQVLSQAARLLRDLLEGGVPESFKQSMREADHGDLSDLDV